MTKLEFDRAEAEKKRTAEQKARDDARAATEADNAIARRIEAQKPFFEKRQEAYFEAIRIASQLTELDLAADGDKWKEKVRKFTQMRWGELEMVGDPGIRNAARLVIGQINHVANSPLANRHNLRWSVECLADELRYSLEHSWGLQKGLKRDTVLGGAVNKVPDGCNQGTEAAVRPMGMPYPAQQVQFPAQQVPYPAQQVGRPQ